MSRIVAIIDDEEDMEHIYALIFENLIKNDLLVLQFFSDSQKFMKWMEHNEPHLILSDINMPFLKGTQVVELIKKSGRSISTYFVSGHDQEEYEDVMKELGVDRFLSKPLNFNHLLDIVGLDLGIPSANL